MNHENDELKKFKGRPLFENVHRVKQPSLLSHKALDIDLKGFLNLAVILICTVNFRLIVERIKKRGFVINVPPSSEVLKNLPLLVCFVCLSVSLLFSWFIERHVACWLLRQPCGGDEGVGGGKGSSGHFLSEDKNSKMKELTKCEFIDQIGFSRGSDEATNDGSVQSGGKSPSGVRRRGAKKGQEENLEEEGATEEDAPSGDAGGYSFGPFENTHSWSEKSNGWKNFHLSIFLLRCINSIFILLLPYLTVTHYDAEPFFSSILLTISIVWFFKIYSFHQVCYDTRKLYIDKVNLDKIKDPSFEIRYVKNYPHCLKLKDYFTYMLMPTLCFQYTYPRTEKTSWSRVAKYSIEAILLTIIIKIILEQYIFITIENTFTMKEFQSAQLTVKIIHIIERMLKISIGTLYIWLIGFLIVFHHWCNILAEITRFDDRLFYKDWWNASSFAEYWRKWNLPIHYFVHRHINKPLIYYGFNRNFSMIVVFFISALLHEYLISIPLKLGFSGYVFFFFIGQIPLIWLTNNNYFKKRKTTGNAIFWIVFCITGQPLIVFIYYYSWVSRKGILHR
ncbi:Diacylglycerol o-acyltransferase [Plasmodium coatneyi]|uniref:O-acyltransferase n=1 Tax=Plasmodium coatneyi TaxID=208452 RepID=A0A1B1DYU4_9APIC|nr:Diacylglycerol o-acyltransferase [Plasmodium coatneyi]ANQ07938.1 Diacylglycerol o-acyltransferase [Plasmodium coatneyi]